MISQEPLPRRRRRGRQASLLFAPLAWLKLLYFCHAGDTEVGGFGVTDIDDLLYVEDFVTVGQHTSAVTVLFDDHAVADFMDRCVDTGLSPQNCLRLWCHTHPGSSAEPSGTDEETFERVFGGCDWAVMFILARTGNTYARLSMRAGPGAATHLAVGVDWSRWSEVVNDPKFSLTTLRADWQDEFATNIHRLPEFASTVLSAPADSLIGVNPRELLEGGGDWSDLDEQIWEEYERHARFYDDDLRA